jgi:hypothetical protein
MTTIRKAKKSTFTSIPNVLAQDNDLSLKARGLMLYILSLPDDWVIRVNHLTKVMKEGRDSILSALKELKKFKYIFHIKLSFTEGWTYFVFEEPTSEEEFKLFLRTNGFSNNWETQQLGNPQLQNTNSITKERLIKKDPPLSPPCRKKPEKQKPEKKDEEDFFSKSKDNKEKKLKKAQDMLRKEGCPQNIIGQATQNLRERGLNGVYSIFEYLKQCAYGLMQENALQGKYERSLEIARKLEAQSPNNFQINLKKNGLNTQSGAVSNFVHFSNLDWFLDMERKRFD